MLRQRQPYRDYPATAPAQRSQEQRLKRLQQQVERLGHQVQLKGFSSNRAKSSVKVYSLLNSLD